MLKKTLIAASVLVMATSVISYANAENATPATTPAVTTADKQEFKRPHQGPDFAKRHAEFEKRLKLTVEQKAQAEQIRQQGFEKMKPIMEKIKEKYQEADAVRRSRIVEQDQKAKLAQIRKEIGALKREAHEIRMQNMKDFEAILTQKQQKELKKMKQEGRKKFEKEHKKRHGEFGPRHKNGDFPPPPPCKKDLD